RKGVFTAASLGLDALAFGCEDPEKLMLAVSAMNESDASRRITRLIDEDNALSYPRARQKYLAEMIGDANFIARPNNILALEYMLAPHEGLAMLPLRRDPSYSSAAELRTIERGEMLASLPPAAMRAFENEPEYSISRLTEAIIAFLRSKKPQELDSIYDMTFDLACRLTAAASSARTLPELLDRLRARTFTDSKLRRLMLNAYFGVTRENALANPSYTVLLAAASGATPLAGEIASRTRIPVVTNPGSYKSILSGKVSEAFERALRAESVVSLCCEGDVPAQLSRSPYIG
ncbi:MAG TPA: nucleotidyltransferase family protein, partial [Bacillota bacterium]|nr:nucleotidyltransferase family protein [Bacillota bacterium]